MKSPKESIRIKKFREYINNHADTLILISKELDNKNYWNCICSAMDWIDLAIEHIEVSSIDNVDWHQYSLQIYMHISFVDIVWESIKQLHKMLINEKTIPFEDDNSIFQDTRLGLDDNRYFMHIRAAFGAHPVNLLEGRKKDGTETIRYASWPTSGIYNEYDYAVLLYSGRKGYNDVPFGFKIKQLTNFFESRYRYLEEIEKAIEKIVDDHFSQKKSIVIDKVNDPIEQLTILETENKTRLNNSYYDEVIHNMKSFFQTDFSDSKNHDVIKCFAELLDKGINEIYGKISAMEVSDLEVDVYLHPDYPHAQQFGYTFSKLSECALGYSNKPLIMLQEVIDPLSDVLSFNYHTIQELYWLVIIALNVKNGYCNVI